MSDDSKYAYPTRVGINGDGMTLREHYAGLAMQGIIANGDTLAIKTAGDAVAFADSLIQELENE